MTILTDKRLPCPRCESKNITTYGFSKTGKRQYRCRECKRIYTDSQKIGGYRPSFNLDQSYCERCGNLGIRSLESNLCNTCYMQDYRKSKRREQGRSTDQPRKGRKRLAEVKEENEQKAREQRSRLIDKILKDPFA